MNINRIKLIEYEVFINDDDEYEVNNLFTIWQGCLLWDGHSVTDIKDMLHGKTGVKPAFYPAPIIETNHLSVDGQSDETFIMLCNDDDIEVARIELEEITLEELLNDADFTDILEQNNLYAIHPDQCAWNATAYQLQVDSWSDIKTANKELSDFVLSDKAEILEAIFNHELCFTDEYSSCSSCGKLIHYGTDYHGTATHFTFDCEILCHDCTDDSDIIEYCINSSDRAIKPSQLHKDITEYDFVLVDDSFETGLHIGMNDSPVDILKKAIEQDCYSDYIFVIDSVSQFSCGYSLYKRGK